MPTIEETAVRYGITTLELFKRAHARYGLVLGTDTPENDHDRWKRHHHQVLYVNKWMRDQQRQIVRIQST